MFLVCASELAKRANDLTRIGVVYCEGTVFDSTPTPKYCS
jgi:hypothetical protein